MRLPALLRPTRSVRHQLVLLSAVASLLAVVVLGVLVQVLLGRNTNAAVGRELADRTSAVSAAASSASTARRIVVPRAQQEAGVVVYDADGSVVAGTVPPPLSEQYERASRSTVAATYSIGDYARVRAAPFTTPDGLRGTVVVGERLAPYEASEQIALLVTIGAGVVLVGISTALAAWVSRRALAPVVTMAATAEDWSEHDLDRRFAFDQRGNELSALAHTLDGLLDKVSDAIRSEQRLTSELAHELRTPLTAVQGGADLLLMREGLDEGVREELEEIRDGCRRMAATITGLLELARQRSTAAERDGCQVAIVVAEAVAEALPSGSEAAHRPAVTTHVAEAARWSVPTALAVRAVTPVLGNAVRFARSRVEVRTRLENGVVALVVEDDGPGVDNDHREAIFEPGHTTGGGGAGLGLALARRIARSTGGDVVLESADLTRFVIRLPAAR